MKNRKSILTLLLLVVLVALADALVYFGPVRGTSAIASRQRSLVEFSGDVSQVEIARAGGGQVTLQRGFSEWRIVSPFAGSADEQVVRRLIDLLTFGNIIDATSDAELLRLGRTRGDFGLDAPVLRVTLQTDLGERTTLSFGTPAPTSEGIYVGVSDVPAVFVVPSETLAASDVPANGFRRRTLLLHGLEGAQRVDIRRSNGSLLEFVREGEQWRLDDRQASTERIAKLLSELSSAKAVGFAWPVGASNETTVASSSLLAGYGLDPDGAVTVTIRGADGLDSRISYGKDAGNGQVYALVHDGTAIVTVSSSLKSDVDRDAADFTDLRLFQRDRNSVGYFSVQLDGVLYSLRKDNKDLWSLESPIVAPANQPAAETVLTRILSLTKEDVACDAGLTVSIATNTAAIGVAQKSVFGSLSPEDLRSKTMLAVPREQVRRIVRTPARQNLVSVVYDRARQAWNVEKSDEDCLVDEEGIAAVLGAVESLRAVRVVKLKVQASELDDYGLDEPFATVAIDREQPETVRSNILIGKRTEGGRFATVGSSDALFVISDDVVDRLTSPIVVK